MQQPPEISATWKVGLDAKYTPSISYLTLLVNHQPVYRQLLADSCRSRRTQCAGQIRCKQLVRLNSNGWSSPCNYAPIPCANGIAFIRVKIWPLNRHSFQCHSRCISHKLNPPHQSFTLKFLMPTAPML